MKLLLNIIADKVPEFNKVLEDREFEGSNWRYRVGRWAIVLIIEYGLFWGGS